MPTTSLLKRRAFFKKNPLSMDRITGDFYAENRSMMFGDAKVASLSRSSSHSFSKECEGRLRLIEGVGVEGDAHAGVTVKHRSRVARDPSQPNLRQVHLIASELLEELAGNGFAVEPGDLGENILTEGVDLLSLPVDARLRVGDEAVLRVTGLRNPCPQIEAFCAGLLAQVLKKDVEGRLVRKAGIMSVVEQGGDVVVGDSIQVELPAEPHRVLERV